jgi:hypothetical protein
MNILIAQEESQAICIEFRARGFNAWSCDLLPCSGGHPEWHLQCDVRIALSAKKKDRTPYWDLIIAHPVCRYMSNSGVRWLVSKKTGINWDRWDKLADAIQDFRLYIRYQQRTGVKMAIENPIPHKYAVDGINGYAGIGPYTQIIHPHQHGHGEQKPTCLWLFGLPEITPTNIVKGREQRIWKLPPDRPGHEGERAKARSKTYSGIAKAMASQWGYHLIKNKK